MVSYFEFNYYFDSQELFFLTLLLLLWRQKNLNYHKLIENTLIVIVDHCNNFKISLRSNILISFTKHKLMITPIRLKTQTISVNNSCEQLNTSQDDSQCQTNTNKRFTRKKDNLQTSKINKSFRATHSNQNRTAQKEISIKDQIKKRINIGTCFIKTEDLFINLNSTPSKSRYYPSQLSSDRATESTNVKQSKQIEGSKLISLDTVKKMKQTQDYSLLEAELQIKTNQLMVLEDENIRMKKTLNQQEQDHLKQIISKQQQHNKHIHALKQQICSLQIQLRFKDEEVRTLKKNQIQFNREIKSLKYEKCMVEKQIEQLYKKKLPKQIKELMSYRQLSLQKQIDQLKLKLQQSKSSKESQLEQQLIALENESLLIEQNNKSLEIHNRILSKKVNIVDVQLKESIELFNKKYLALKINNKQLQNELKQYKKQNCKLKRISILATTPKRPRSPSSENDSLSLSLSNH